MARARTETAVRFLASQYSMLPCALCDAWQACESDANEAGRILRDLLSGYSAARRLLQGVVIALVGPTNAGKSTLFNRLAGRTAAVVSAQAGTTRDWVSAELDLAGLPVTLIDTAGERHLKPGLESEAIFAGSTRATQADLRVLVLDATQQPNDATDAMIRRWLACGPLVVAANKCDLAGAGPGGKAIPSMPVCTVSAQTGAGMSDLADAIRLTLDIRGESQRTSVFTARQADLANRAAKLLPQEANEAARIIRDDLLGRRATH